MLLHDRGAQAVDQIFEIRLAVRCELRLRHQCAGSQPRQRDGSAENGEEFPPPAALCHAVKRTEDHQHGDERQNGKHRLGLSAVFRIDRIGDVGVEGRVVRGRAEEGHHAVEHNDHRCRRGRGLHRRKEPCRVFHRNQAERRRGGAPEDVAAADEQLSLPNAV